MDYFIEKNIKNILYVLMFRKFKLLEIIDKFNEIVNIISNKFGDRIIYINIILVINERILVMEKVWVYFKFLEKILKELYEGLIEVNRLIKIY